MYRKTVQSGLGRWLAASVAFGACWALVRPWKDHALTFSAPLTWSPESDEQMFGCITGKFAYPAWMPRVEDLRQRGRCKWLSLSEDVLLNFVHVKRDHAARGFFVLIHDAWQQLSRASLRYKGELEGIAAACFHALGNDIEVQAMGSFARLTTHAFDVDIDLQVTRRPESHQVGMNFTEIDEQKVARNLEKLRCVTGPVTIGNVAIKFQLHGTIPVDLVLSNPRAEDFPNLRGGDNFSDNCDRINNILEQTPAVLFAIIGVKFIQPNARPKGILLEAIACRLAEIYPLPLTSGVDMDAMASVSSLDVNKSLHMECFQFYLYVAESLSDWETTSFGRDLKLDLQNLPDHKAQEYMDGFERFQEPEFLELLYVLLFVDVQYSFSTEEWLDEGFDVELQKRLSESFPFDF